MKVLLVEPNYEHPFPHLFILKAITFWRDQGAEVMWTKGYGIEASGYEPNMIQMTTPIFSWAVPNCIQLIKFYQEHYPRAKIEVGGVMATLHAKIFEAATGIKPFEGVHGGIINSRPAWEEFPKQKLCRVMITAGCGVGCGFCLVTPMYKAKSYEIFEWQSHFAERDYYHVIDDNFSQSIATIKGLGDRLLEFFSTWTKKKTFDLNSGVEPRSFNDSVAATVCQLPIKPIRTALDETSEADFTLKAIQILHQKGFDPRRIHVYLLYGWRDDIQDALYRLSILMPEGKPPIAVPMAMRFVPLDWFGGRFDYQPPQYHRLHYIDFARYVNQLKRHSLFSLTKRWTFKEFLERCESHNHSNDPILKGDISITR